MDKTCLSSKKIVSLFKNKFMKQMKTDHLSVIHIIDEYDSLRKGLKFIINNSKSNCAPYHNLNHMLTVTRHVYNGLEYMNMLEDPRCEELL